MSHPILRHFPGVRLAVKLFLLDHAMIIAAQLADDPEVPARDRMVYGKRVMQLVRWHRRLHALTAAREEQ